jgi:PPOX class probable F420-dependent enzyme
MNRRDQIAFTVDERKAYVAAARTIILTSQDPHGYPHPVPMWFVVDADETVWMTTYRKSQKTLNVQRNPKVALLVESGVTYESLKGALIRGDAEVIDDVDSVLQVLKRVHGKMFGSLPDGVEEGMRAQATKRVVIKVVPKKVSSWDHAKLRGSY